MKQAGYKTGFKVAGAILQGILVGVLIYCLMNAFYWMEDSSGFSEMGKNFEETSVFLEQVERAVRDKIAYDQNKELFELDGQYDGTKEVDIRQYTSGMVDEANLNLNTTYYVQELIDFYSGGAQQMGERLQKLSDSGLSEQEIGERLDGEAMELETILPISGNSLADYARMNVNPSSALREYYQLLCETSRDIYQRYQQYLSSQQEPEGEENSEAPSNVRYYIENTSTKQRYTNLSVKSFAAAQRMIQNSEELSFLYSGERSFNIMISNAEYVMNEAAAQWFIGARFLGAGEKVILAVDLSYPIGDRLQELYTAFEQREPVLMASVIVGVICVLLLICLVVLSIVTTGRKGPGEELVLNGFDRIPTEIGAGLCLIAGIIWYFFITEVGRRYIVSYIPREMMAIGAVVLEYWIFLASLLSLVRRIKGKTLWDNSVCYAVALGCSQVYNARKNSKRLLIAYVIFFMLNLFFTRFFGMAGIIMALVMDMAVLLYLMRDEVGKQNVREGLYQISQGRLNYKIETKALAGESLEMARAVNDMGDGLQQAVDSIIKNERLKAELITNVSHDIKTPLTSIINYVDLLKREELGNERAAEYIRVLEQKSQRLKQLTEDLIEASKINSGNIELHRDKLQLQQMLQQAYGEFAERLEENKLEAVLSITREPVTVYVDGRQLWRIFENLLGNIVKYAMPGTRVYLELNRMEELAEVTFKNISRQKLAIGAEELQERFVRGDLSRNTEGSGLGLSIAKSLTELMDGSFQVYVDGDSFQVTLLFPVCAFIPPDTGK